MVHLPLRRHVSSTKETVVIVICFLILLYCSATQLLHTAYEERIFENSKLTLPSLGEKNNNELKEPVHQKKHQDHQDLDDGESSQLTATSVQSCRQCLGVFLTCCELTPFFWFIYL